MTQEKYLKIPILQVSQRLRNHLHFNINLFLLVDNEQSLYLYEYM